LQLVIFIPIVSFILLYYFSSVHFHIVNSLVSLLVAGVAQSV